MGYKPRSKEAAIEAAETDPTFTRPVYKRPVGLNLGSGAPQAPSDPEFLEAVSIDPQHLDEELTQIAARIAYWGIKLNAARYEERMARVTRNTIRGELSEQYREQLEAIPDSGRVTDKAVLALVEQDADYHAAQTALGDAEQICADLTTICEALKVKSEALRSLCANRRAEQAALYGAP